jgi:hypothetical protein
MLGLLIITIIIFLCYQYCCKNRGETTFLVFESVDRIIIYFPGCIITISIIYVCKYVIKYFVGYIKSLISVRDLLYSHANQKMLVVLYTKFLKCAIIVGGHCRQFLQLNVGVCFIEFMFGPLTDRMCCKANLLYILVKNYCILNFKKCFWNFRFVEYLSFSILLQNFAGHMQPRAHALDCIYTAIAIDYSHFWSYSHTSNATNHCNDYT